MLRQGLADAERVRTLVLELLAKRDRLLCDRTHLVEAPVIQDGKLCGIHFTLRGPRNVLLTAIWDARSRTLWCYDSRGKRFANTEIEGQPEG